MPTCAYDHLRAIMSLDRSQSPDFCERYRGWRDNEKPDLICPNGKHIYTVWIVPYRLRCALHAIHCTGNTNTEQVTDLRHSFSVYL